MAYSKEYTYQLIKIWSTPKKISTTCCKKCQKSPNQETGLGNRGRLKSLNETKLVINEHEWPLNHLGSIWYHSVPYSPCQFLGWDFLCHFLQQDCSSFSFVWKFEMGGARSNSSEKLQCLFLSWASLLGNL